ncbi:hypothetical protein BV898_01240 [Hypsibius exemplaris]|uniref:Uncharacterized protein n=1 Tax=Hypsibius exemplaris TaxID=2072580 RepID=A0A1W0XC06_HYPEX|nr:hypothetical protein BV898_01240 [Hypsibius exemplaris]
MRKRSSLAWWTTDFDIRGLANEQLIGLFQRWDLPTHCKLRRACCYWRYPPGVGRQVCTLAAQTYHSYIASGNARMIYYSDLRTNANDMSLDFTFNLRTGDYAAWDVTSR